MPRILLVAQDKGGVGKTVVARALAEAVPDAPIIEIDASRRLLELGDRVRFFPMRADRAEIERTGGRAARAEFDPIISAMEKAELPMIVDIGANTSGSLLAVLADLAPDLMAVGIEIGVLVVVTAEPGALAEAPKLMALAKSFAASRFLVANQFQGELGEEQLGRLAEGAKVKSLAEQAMEKDAVELLQAGGLASISRLDPAKLNERHGIAKSARIRRDLTRFRAEAMEAVSPAAEWLVGDAEEEPMTPTATRRGVKRG